MGKKDLLIQMENRLERGESISIHYKEMHHDDILYDFDGYLLKVRETDFEGDDKRRGNVRVYFKISPKNSGDAGTGSFETFNFQDQIEVEETDDRLILSNPGHWIITMNKLEEIILQWKGLWDKLKSPIIAYKKAAITHEKSASPEEHGIYADILEMMDGVEEEFTSDYRRANLLSMIIQHRIKTMGNGGGIRRRIYECMILSKAHIAFNGAKEERVQKIFEKIKIGSERRNGSIPVHYQDDFFDFIGVMIRFKEEDFKTGDEQFGSKISFMLLPDDPLEAETQHLKLEGWTKRIEIEEVDGRLTLSAPNWVMKLLTELEDGRVRKVFPRPIDYHWRKLEEFAAPYAEIITMMNDIEKKYSDYDKAANRLSIMLQKKILEGGDEVKTAAYKNVFDHFGAL